MRTVRLGGEATAVGADVRAAISAWGMGDEILGGIALLGWTPPESASSVDAVLVLPRGVIVVYGVDLPQPALKLDATPQRPWSVDGWPLVRSESAANPTFGALETTAALTRLLRTRGAEELPVTTIVAVGPYVEEVIHPESQPGLRVLYPSATSMLTAARKLTDAAHPCPADTASRLLAALDDQAGRLATAELIREGFPDPARLAAADTMTIPRIRKPAAPLRAPRLPGPAALSPRARILAGSAGLVALCGLVVLLVVATRPAATDPEPSGSVVRMDGMQFVRESAVHDGDCANNTLGVVRSWFQGRGCAGMSRAVFDTTVSGRRATVSVALVQVPDEDSARELRDLLNATGGGGIATPRHFDTGARAVESAGAWVRVVQAAWSDGVSSPQDIELRALTERGMRLPLSP